MISDHTYERPRLDKGQVNSLSIILEHIPEDATVLDVGSATGRLGEYLAAHTLCKVDAIEANPLSAEAARQHYRNLYIIDLDDVSGIDAISEHYDVIVIADVLEHLRNPDAVLSRLRDKLTEHGRVLISLPNIAHISVVLQLLQGRFEYREDGLLDKTHLRFFTIDSAFKFVREAGFQHVKLIDRVIVGTQGTEFAFLLNQGVNFRLLDALRTLPEGNTYQFILECRPNPEGIETTQAHLPTASIQGIYINPTVFYSHTTELDAPLQLTQRLTLQDRRFQIDFILPDNIQALRFDPCDIPGMVRLYALELLDENNQILWRLQPSDIIEDKSQSLSLYWNQAQEGQPYALLHCRDSDPWMRLPTPPGLLRRSRLLRIDIHWPHSDDFTLIELFFLPFVDSWRREAAEALNRAKTLEHEVAESYNLTQRLHREIGLLNDSNASFKKDLDNVQCQLEKTTHALDHLRRLQESPKYMLKALVKAIVYRILK